MSFAPADSKVGQILDVPNPLSVTPGVGQRLTKRQRKLQAEADRVHFFICVKKGRIDGLRRCVADLKGPGGLEKILDDARCELGLEKVDKVEATYKTPDLIRHALVEIYSELLTAEQKLADEMAQRVVAMCDDLRKSYEVERVRVKHLQRARSRWD